MKLVILFIWPRALPIKGNGVGNREAYPEFFLSTLNSIIKHAFLLSKTVKDFFNFFYKESTTIKD